jgi:hypothetical protein
MSPRKMDGAHSGLFPAEAGPTDTARSPGGTGFSRESVRCHTAEWMVLLLAYSRLKPVPLTQRDHLVGPGFSREGVGCHTAKWMVLLLASSRLKPVPLTQRDHLVGPALAGKRRMSHRKMDGAPTGPFPAGAGPTDTTRSPRGTGFSRETSHVTSQNGWCSYWPLPG